MLTPAAKSRIPRTCAAALLALLLAVLSGCQDAGAPAALPPTATPQAFVLMSDLLKSPASQHQVVTTVGTLLVGPDGGVLVDAIVYDAQGMPQPLDTGTPQLWVGANARSHVQGKLRSAGKLEYASMIARAQLDGPGSYGPGGKYQYQLSNPTFEPLSAQETTIGDLLDQPAAYDNRLVRLVGGLLIRGTSSLLIDKIGSGGIPAPKARQLKLRTPIADQALVSRLKSAPGGAVHFGQAQVEGFWRNGMLTPFSFTVAT